MPNRTIDPLFQLIQSLERAEKRNFKLYMTRNTGTGNLKVVQLFDALDKMAQYDEAVLLKKTPSIQKQQLSNLKAHLYQEILASVRLLKQEENIDLQLHEQLDFARILYNKGLNIQSLKILDKVKELAKANNQVTYIQQVLFLEKKIESLHITRSMQDRAEKLCAESNETNERLVNISTLSNLSLLLYEWYIRNGHARNEEDKKSLDVYFNHPILHESEQGKGFYEKLYLYQCFCWYAFITKEFLAFIETPVVQNNINNKVQCFTYLYTAKLNKHFMEGTFTKGLSLVPEIEERLLEYEVYLDRHRTLVFYYKIASLYFGSGDAEKSIDYLNKIINLKVDLRTDLQCYARLLHMIAHYEMGNFDLLKYLLKSVYRFMAKMQNLSAAEEAVFSFLKQSFHSSPNKVKPLFQNLLTELKGMANDRMETRAFMYLDFISWLESKIQRKPVQSIIRQKFIAATKRTSDA